MAIGEKYKELRKEQSITLAQAAKGICATSNLSLAGRTVKLR